MQEKVWNELVTLRSSIKDSVDDAVADQIFGFVEELKERNTSNNFSWIFGIKISNSTPIFLY